jgi:hypothetical protein
LTPEARILKDARTRAIKYNLPFDLYLEDIQIPDYCPVLGFPLAKIEGFPNRASPSLDRMDPVKGYVRGNVRVISTRANQLKSDASVEELAAVLRDLIRLKGQDN